MKTGTEAEEKTGTEADERGVYSSECCDYEVVFDKGQTLTRCPKCSSLTIWYFTGELVTQAA